MAVEFKTLTFPNNEQGQAEKIKALQWYSEEGWEVVSENITQGRFRGTTAFCLAMLICLPAAFCAGSSDGEITVTLKRDTSRLSSRDTAREVITVAATPVTSQSAASTPIASLPASSKKIYEPVIGVETDALIERAFLFLEDGENYEAERYIEQALNQAPKNPQVYMAKLMLEHKVSTPEELIQSMKTPLEDKKLYQRALRFADGEYKSQLEDYAQKVRDKLEQERLAREAERERVRLEKEAAEIARKEELYQEILKAKEEAVNKDDLSALLNKLRAIMPYKDTEKIYEEAQTTYSNEQKYASALILKKYADSSDSFRGVIEELEPLAEVKYKDSELLLAEAREALNKAEQYERRKKVVKIIIAFIAVMILAIFFYSKYSERLAQEQRQQEQAKLAQRRMAREEAQRHEVQDKRT